MPKHSNASLARIATFFLFLHVVCLVPASVVGRQSGGTTAGQIVAQFFPAALTSGPEVTPGSWVEQTRESAFVVLDTLPDGSPRTLLVAYTNGIRGAIRLIQAQSDGTYQVTYEPSSLHLRGLYVSAELLDLDGDSQAEAILSFTSFRNQTADWIFRWNGNTVENLTPMEPTAIGTSITRLVLAKFVDVDHDGKLEIISEENYPPQEAPGQTPSDASVIYKLGPSGYTADKAMPFWQTYVRRTGPPQIETLEFSLPASSLGPYTLKLVNGEANGSNRVGFVRIKLNGAEILSASQFSQQVEFLDLTVNLQQTNTIEVTLAETPPGQVWITIQDEGVGTPTIAGTIAAQGRDAEGNFFVDLQLQNTGNGHARDLEIDAIALQLLSGTGEVTRNTTLSPTLPHAIGDLDVGASVIRRFYLNVPSTVTRFSIKEAGPFKNLLGTNMVFITEQEVIP